VTAGVRAEAGYSHTQVGWWLIVTLGIVCLAILAIFRGVELGRQSLPPTDARIIGWVVFVTLLITTVLLTTLTVRVTSESVAWRFGPGVVHFSLPLAEITNVTATRTPLWAGIGIHWIFTGWVYNVSGRRAVELTKRDGSKVWIGTDEPDLLAAAIERARAAINPATGAAPRSGSR
jgi:hypothetical protein